MLKRGRASARHGSMVLPALPSSATCIHLPPQKRDDGRRALDGRSVPAKRAQRVAAWPPLLCRKAAQAEGAPLRKPLDCILVFSQSAAATRSPRGDAPALPLGGKAGMCKPHRRAPQPPPAGQGGRSAGTQGGRSPKFKGGPLAPSATPIFFISCKAALALLHASNTLCCPRLCREAASPLRGAPDESKMKTITKNAFN